MISENESSKKVEDPNPIDYISQVIDHINNKMSLDTFLFKINKKN